MDAPAAAARTRYQRGKYFDGRLGKDSLRDFERLLKERGLSLASMGILASLPALSLFLTAMLAGQVQLMFGAPGAVESKL